ncbi:MAG TPA: DUF5715 family protein [Gemmatimonadaceae bacterium]|nr:DUF5715 family protein [Gemmatimonadaceae bacterium]
MTSRLLIAAILVAFPAASASASSLHGSHASMLRQHAVAVKNDFTFLRTAKQVREFAASDRLEEITDTDDYQTAGVSFPFTRPVVKLFIERLAQQYRAATGDPLVVTSLTRPTTLQPRNASPLSVHPAGMAVDFRVPADAAARSWLEKTLLSLEDKGLLDVTREHHPSHLHVAVFPDAYASYVAKVALNTAAITPVVTVPVSAASAAVASVANAMSSASRPASERRLPWLVVALSGALLLLVAYRWCFRL